MLGMYRRNPPRTLLSNSRLSWLAQDDTSTFRDMLGAESRSNYGPNSPTNARLVSDSLQLNCTRAGHGPEPPENTSSDVRLKMSPKLYGGHELLPCRECLLSFANIFLH